MVKRLGWTLGGVVLVVLALGALSWALLPAIIEKSIERLVSSSLPGQSFTCQVRRVSLTEADLAAIVLGNPAQPALRIDSLHLNYSLAGLFNRHVERVALAGLLVQGQCRSGRFVLAGFPETPAEASPKKADSGFTMPGTIGQLSLNRGLLRCQVGDKIEQLPFSVQLAQEKSQGPGEVIAPLAGSIKLYPEGRELVINLKGGWAAKDLNFKVDSKDFPLSSLAALLDMDLAGRLQFTAEGRIGLDPVVVSYLDMQATIEQFSLAGGDGSWRVQGAGPGGAPPFHLALGVVDGKWDVVSTGLVLHGPVELSIGELKGGGVLGVGGGRGSGSLRLGLQLSDRQNERLQAKGEIKTAFSPQCGWSFALQGVAEKAQKNSPPPPFSSFTLELKKDPVSALTVAASISDLALQQPYGRTLLVPDLKVSAVLSELGLGRGGQVELQVPELLVGNGQTELRLAGLAASLPLPWTVAKPGSGGQVRLARIIWNGEDLGDLELSATPRAKGLLFSGTHRSRVLEGVALKVKGQMDISSPEGLRASLQLSAPRQKFTAVNPGRFVGAQQEISLSGEFALEAKGAYARGETSGGLQLQFYPDGGGEKTPAPFVLVVKVGGGKWDLTSSGLALPGLVALTIDDLKGAGLLGAGGGSGAGSLRLGLQLPGQEGEELRARSEFKGAFNSQGGWSLSLHGISEPTKDPSPSLACGAFALELKKQPDAGFTLAANLTNLALRTTQDQALKAPELKVSVLLPELAFGRGGRMELHVPELLVRDGQTELRLAGLTANLPLPQDAPNPAATGQVQLDRIFLNGQDLGDLQLTAASQAKGLLFSGTHHSKVLAGVALQVKAQMDISPPDSLGGSLQLSVPPQKFTAFNLGRFVKAKQELSLSGEFALEATGTFAREGRSAGFQLQLKDTHLELPKRGIAVDGLNLALAMPDLFQKRSQPAQPLTFATAKVGDLALADGKFAFQIESLTSLLLESGSFAWCDGHVYTLALRLASGSKDYEVTLFCDRLRLAGLLAQFGLQAAEGDGTLNGQIQLKVVDDRVSFVDGFLYSSPGDGGNIRIGTVGLLKAGIPKGTPQYSQLDFAGEALKNFHYNWAKLRLRSQGEELLLEINLDGQPAQPIPFKYNSKLGSLSRLDVGETGGIIHPILLDLNLRLPFQQILQYGGGVKKLYQMTQ